MARPDEGLASTESAVDSAATVEAATVGGSLAAAVGMAMVARGVSVVQLAWPGTSNVEACTFTNASMSNFARWRRRVAKAETAP